MKINKQWIYKCKLNLRSLKLRRTKNGFTLIEMMISIFIFAIIMTSVASIFARQISAYKTVRTIEADLENAQFALNYISKTLRTASIIGYGTSTGAVTDLAEDIESDIGDENDFYTHKVDPNVGLLVYDFSQEECVLFTFVDKAGEKQALWVETQTGVPITEIEQCMNTTGADTPWHVNDPTQGYKLERLTTGSVTGFFDVAATRYQDVVGSRNTDTMGRATISMKVEPAENADVDNVKPIYIQSSVALRDYPSDLSF